MPVKAGVKSNITAGIDIIRCRLFVLSQLLLDIRLSAGQTELNFGSVLIWERGEMGLGR